MVTQSDIPDAVRRPTVASVAEWHAAGLTQAQLRRLVNSGDLIRVRHAVYATRAAVKWAKASPRRGHALRAIAAQAAVGRDSVASHQSAALIHGLDLFPAAADMVTLTRPPTRRCNRPRSDGIIFHTAHLPTDHVTRILGARVTSVARTVVDIARTSSLMSAVVTADSALRAALALEAGAFVTRETLASVCDTCAGWPGIRNARRAAGFADPRAESVLESCARVIFHEHGLEPPELQVTITGPDFRYTVDFYWPRHRVIAEADGEVKYSDPRRAIRQLERDQRLRDHGDKVVHFTWRELFKTPEAVPDRIRRAFASPGPN
jgi:hypothetical protein